jgi:hypothetical protein
MTTPWSIVIVAFAWFAGVSEVHAHAFSPSLLAMRELARGEAEVTWKTPRLQVMGARIRPALPPGCRQTTAPVAEESEAAVMMRWQVDCRPAGLIGERIGIDGLETANTNGLIRVALIDGRLVQRVVTADAPALSIPARPRRLDVLRDYGRLGIAHILGGFDHLLFVLGLLLLVPSTWPLAKTITAFTLGHSVTLSAAVLGVVALPPGPIEVVIALTILVLATELAREGSPTLMRRFPWVMALAFGLLHGFGFAGALHEAGLPTGDIPLALCAFNAGIELGQLAFVGTMLLVRSVTRNVVAALPAWVEQVPVYVMGSLAAFWCFERAAALLR